MQSGALLSEVARLVPSMQARANRLDIEEAFPEEDIADLQRIGAITAVLPTALGGLGAGTEPGGREVILGLLTTIGRGNLAVGRLFEAHVNAMRLIVRHGTPDQVSEAAQDTALFGLWVTDPPGQVLSLDGGALRGSKGPCSGAGHMGRALVTVATPGGTRMAVVELTGAEKVRPLRGALPGMRAAVNGSVTFDAMLPDAALIGQDGDYLLEPDFSCGAWRTSAVTLGGLMTLTEEARRQLLRKGHSGAPLQQERFGQVLIATETARLWTEAASHYGELDTYPVTNRVAYVNLARLAVEAAVLSAMTLVQRGLGFGAFIRPNPVERLCRDLSVYLRQPAPDSVLLEAAQHGFMQV